MNNGILRGHAIVCGYGHLGSRIAAQLQERGFEVVIVDKNVDTAIRKRLETLNYRLIEGDMRDIEVLEEAGVRAANCLIAATGDDCANLEAAIESAQIAPNTAIVVRLFDQTMAQRVEKVLNIRALSASLMASPSYVSAATNDSIIALINLDGCYLNVYRADGEQLFGQLPAGVFIQKSGSALKTVHSPPDPKDSEEYFFATMSSTSQCAFLKGPSIRKKGVPISERLRRLLIGVNPAHFLRQTAGIWNQAAGVSKGLLVALILVGLASVGVFCRIGQMSPLDAIYFVVTTMTTVGYGDFNLQHAPDGLKIFGIVMMLSGAALLATIYAIIAEHVLTSRMEYLLGRRKVKLRGHTVVVGLGKIGFRVAHDLKKLGLNVVAIEVNQDLDNLSAARLMFPVVIGDASRPSILQKASVDNAAAILALTDDPLLNLSIALHANECNPGIRSIMRTYETNLAEKLKSFQLGEVISTSAIASPAFVDAAVFPDVQGSFNVDGCDVLIARHIVNNRSPLIGKSIETIGDECGIAVISHATAPKWIYEPVKPAMIIKDGQKLIVLLAREKIQLLSRL